jgi:PAS domain S-box-containing protein
MSPPSTEVALRESEDRYRQLVELLPNPLVVHIAEKLAYVNPAALTLFGAQSAEELIGKPIWDIILPEYHEQIRDRLRQIRTEGRAVQFFECKLRRLDEQLIDVEVAGAAMTYAGHPAIQTVIRDLTERKRADQALRASEEHYRNLFENANDAIAAFTVEGTVTDINTGAEVLLGWAREELIGQSYHKVLTPATQVTAAERTRRYLAGEDMPSIFEIELVRKDGEIVPVEARTRPIRDRTGKTVGFQGTYRDIRERKKAEAALRESQRLQERIADTLPEILYLYELASGRVVYCNRRVTAVLGYTPAEIEGQPLAALRHLVHEDDHARLATWDQQWTKASDDDHFEIEYRIRHLNGAYRWLHVRERVCTRTDTGAPARILGLATDITVHKHVRDLADTRRLKRQDIPERLRKFRESLGYTQAEFGRRFGGLNQRQIGSYETGVADPSLDLLLAIQERGYPLSYILGTEREALLDETLSHLTRGYSRQVMIEQLAEVVRGIATHERETMARVLRELGLEATPLTTAQREALEQAARLLSRPSEQS